MRASAPGNRTAPQAVFSCGASDKGKALEYIIRFLAGGIVVSAFALLGDIFAKRASPASLALRLLLHW
jgi:hypothetical protein